MIMKKKNRALFLFCIIVLLFSCTKSENSGMVPTAPVILDSGTIVFYSDDNSIYDIDVEVNGNNVGVIRTSVNTTPDCGMAGTITLRYPVGSARYKGLIKGDVLWENSVTVQKDLCTKVFLNKYGDEQIIKATAVDSFFSFRLNNSPVSFKYPWWAHIWGDALSAAPTTCKPNLGIKLFFRAHNQYRDPFPYTVPTGTCTAGPGGNNSNFEFHFKMNNRPIAGQQFTSCDGQTKFSASISEQANYGYYGIESPGDYITVIITNVTGLTLSGVFHGSLTRYRTQNCQKIILGRGEITNGIFKTKYKFN
jgi:hypothetical protein